MTGKAKAHLKGAGRHAQGLGGQAPPPVQRCSISSISIPALLQPGRELHRWRWPNRAWLASGVRCSANAPGGAVACALQQRSLPQLMRHPHCLPSDQLHAVRFAPNDGAQQRRHVVAPRAPHQAGPRPTRQSFASGAAAANRAPVVILQVLQMQRLLLQRPGNELAPPAQQQPGTKSNGCKAAQRKHRD